MYNTSHEASGCWAFDTINPNCWGGAVGYTAGTKADFVAAQETKVPEQEVDDKVQAARNAGWKVAIEPCNITTLNGRSAGVAVGCRNNIGARNSVAAKLPSELKGRLALKHFGAVCKGGIHFGSCYMVSKIGILAEKIRGSCI